MANNKVQVKRTSTSGRTPNTTNSGNLQYIAAGEFALNMTDQILYTSDGTNLIEVGANNTTARITNSLTIDNNKPLRFRTVNTAAAAYFIQQNDDNFVFYTTDASYAARPVWSIFANSSTSALGFGTPVNFTGANVNLGTTRVFANGGSGTSGQVLTSNGTATYWASVGAASVNVDAQYTWTNTHTFNANISFGNNIALTTAAGIYFNGIADANWRVGRNTGTTTKFFYTGNTIDIVAAGSSLEGVAIGQPGANTYLETGYNGTYTRLPVYIGNSTVNVTINSTSFTGTANNSLYLGGTLAASYVQNTDSRTLSGNLIFSGSNTTINAEFRVVNSTANVFFAAANGNVGIGTTTPAAPLHIPSATYPVALMERTSTLTTGMRSTFVAQHTSTADMTDGFGADISFRIKDNANVDNEIGNIGARRDGADNNGRLAFITWLAGVGTENMTIKSNGNVGISNTTPAHKLRVDGTTSLAGAVSDITTLAAGNTTVTGFINATSSVNTATFTVGTAFTANSTLVNAAAINITGQVNTATLYAATSANIASAVQANATGVYTTGTMNAASLTVGTTFIANTTKLTLASGSVFEIPGTSVITSFAADPIDSTNKVFAYRVYPTISYDPVSLTNGDSISGAVFSSSLKASSNLTTGAIYGYGNFTALSTDATSSGGYQNHDLRGIYGNMYHYHNSNLLRMVGTAGRTYNRGTGTVSAAYSLWARSSTSTGGGVITDSHGIFVDDIAAGANNFGITSTVSSGTNKWNFYANGSAQNYFAGNVGIGNTTPAFKLRVDGTTSLAGAVSDITTLAAGNTTVTGFVNATSSVNTATFTVGTAFTANSTVVNAVSYYSGTLLVANTTVINATHLVGSTWAAPPVIGSSTANGISLTYANVTGQVNTATLFATTSANVGANVQLTTSTLLIGNSTVNSNHTSALLQVANSTTIANVTAAGIQTYTNSTVNSTVTASLVQVSNSTSTANLTALDLKIGATTVVNSTQITATLAVANLSGSYANITGQVNTATLYATTSANIASAVQANATGVYTTGTMNAASHTVGTAFTANSTVVNAVSYYSGTLLVANTTVINATHLSGSTWAAPQILGATTANGASLTYANVSGQVNTATLYATTSANVASVVQANSLGIFTTLVANAQNFTAGAGYGAATVGATVNSGTIGISSNTTVNASVTSSLVQVSNASGNIQHTATSILSQTNTTVNSTMTASLVQVANSTTIANVTAAGIQAYTNSTVNAVVTASLVQVANSTATSNLTAQGLLAGANVVANTTTLKVGNTTLTTTNAVFGGTIAANGGIGSAGQALISGGAANTYWSTIGNGTVTSVGSGNGLTGGPITGSGTLSVVAGIGTVVNATGVHVLAGNTTIFANSLGTYVNTTALPAAAVNTDATYTWTNAHTYTFGANAITLTNATSNWIGWNTSGVAAPAVTTRSAGTKLTLYPGISATTVDYAIGIENSHIWLSGSDLTTGVKWYANTTNYMTTNVAGLYHTGLVNAVSFYSGAQYGGATAGMSANATLVGVSSNTTVNAGMSATILQVANSTGNVQHTATSVIAQTNSTVNATHTASLFQVSNSTSTANLTALDLKIGATTTVNSTQVTATLFSGNIAGAYANITGQVNTSTIYATTSANIASVVQANSLGIFTTATSNAQNFTAGAGYGAASVGATVNSGTIGISTNTTVNASVTASLVQVANATGNIQHTATSILSQTNTTVNSTITASVLQVSNSTSIANVVATGLQVYTNSTVNSTVSSSLVQISNSTSTANLTALDLKIGATTVVNSTQITATLFSGALTGSYANISGQVNTATLYATTSANIASAVQANSTGIWTTGTVNGAVHSIGTTFVANTLGVYHTGTMNAASYTVGTAFTANSTVVNAVSYYSGTLLVANTTVINATHLAGSTWAAPQILGATTANGASLTYANVSGQVNTTTLYAVTSANVASIVQANSLGVHVGANVVANTTTLKVGNTTLTTTNAVFGGTIAANGGIGSAGQVLTSGGAGNVYWAAAGGGGSVYLKGGSSTIGTLGTEGQNLFRVNGNTLNFSTTFAAGENAQATGPITVASGITLTIDTGARVSIV